MSGNELGNGFSRVCTANLTFPKVQKITPTQKIVSLKPLFALASAVILHDYMQTRFSLARSC